jgi:hypothetical protein
VKAVDLFWCLSVSCHVGTPRVLAVDFDSVFF